MAFERKEHQGGAVVSALASDIASNDTALDLTDSTNWPTGGTGPFYLVIDPGLSGEEKILATSRSANTLSGLTRGVDGTSGAAHSAGAVIKHVFTAGEADEANQVAHQVLGAVTSKGDMVIGTSLNTVARQAVGANDTVHVADSAQTTGTKWSTLASASLASDSVTTVKIADVNVTTPKLANGAVTVAKLAPVPGCRLFLSTDYSVANNTLTSIQFDTELYDTDSMFTVATPYQIFATTAGKYTYRAMVRFASNSTGYRRLQLRKNGTTIIASSSVPAINGAPVDLSVSCDLTMVAADYVEVLVFHTGGADINITSLSPWSPNVTAHYFSS